MHAFDLKNCVTVENRIFAWDARTKSVVEIEMFSVSISDVPKDALKALLIAANKE